MRIPSGRAALALTVLTALLAGCTSSGAPAAPSTPRSTPRAITSPAAPTSSVSTSPVKQAFSLHPGAAVLAGDVTHVPHAALEPTPAEAPNDIAAYDKEGCQVPQPAKYVKVCTFGDTKDPVKTVAVVGDSVAGEWLPALQDIAAKRKWKLVTLLHSRCPFTDTMTVNSGTTVAYTSCHDWGAAALGELLTTIKPAAVLTSDRPTIGTTDYAAHTPAALAEIGHGMATYWRRLVTHKIAVVAIQESPETGLDQPSCLQQNNDDPGPCTVSRADAVISDAPTVVAAHDVPAASLIDLNSLICGPKNCSPIVGNVLVYRDNHHLTTTYVHTMAPYLDTELQQISALR